MPARITIKAELQNLLNKAQALTDANRLTQLDAERRRRAEREQLAAKRLKVLEEDAKRRRMNDPTMRSIRTAAMGRSTITICEEIPPQGPYVGAEVFVCNLCDGNLPESVQWLRDGEPIPGETQLSYTIVVADLDKRISTAITCPGQPTYETEGFIAGTLNNPAPYLDLWVKTTSIGNNLGVCETTFDAGAQGLSFIGGPLTKEVTSEPVLDDPCVDSIHTTTIRYAEGGGNVFGPFDNPNGPVVVYSIPTDPPP